MSAKGRGKASVPFDYYPTPAWCVDRLLDDCGGELFAGASEVLEPTVGDGAIVRACQAWHERNRWERRWGWTGVELRESAVDSRTGLARLVEGVDFRTWEPNCTFDLAVGNPPFALAESIVRHALKLSTRVAMLLRVGFLGSEERVAFWREHGDVALRVLPNRPSFDGEGTDSSTYGWFVWNCPGVTGVRVLDETPVEVRNAQKPGSLHVDPRQASLFAEAS